MPVNVLRIGFKMAKATEVSDEVVDVPELKELLEENESLFKWNLDMDHPADLYIKSQLEKIDNISEITDFKWHSFVLNLLIAYELCDKQKNYDKAIEHIELCVGLLDSAKDTEEEFYKDHIKSLWHITGTTQIQILLAADKKEKIPSVIEKITPVKEMSSTEQAGVMGIKAAIYLQYSTKSHRVAMDTVRKAIDLNPKEPEWWFILGKALGRIRRAENTKITVEEMNAIKKAYEMRKDNSYRVHLATIFADYAKELYFTFKKHNIEKSRYYTEQAVALFKEALEMQPDDQFMKARVAHSLIRIRFKNVLDISFVKKLLDEIVVNAPNNAMAFHDMGMYYEKFENNTRKALQNFERSAQLGNVKAVLSALSLKWRHGLREIIIADLKNDVDIFLGKDNKGELLVHLGICYILLQDDWASGLDCLCSSLELDPSGSYLKDFHPYKGKYNTLTVITNKLRLKMQEETDAPEVYKTFLDKVKRLKRKIFHRPPKQGDYENWKRDQLAESKRR